MSNKLNFLAKSRLIYSINQSYSSFLSSSAQVKGQFRRRDTHLYTTVSVGLDDALLGFERNLTHFDDRAITLKRSGVTQPGYVQTVTNQGMPLGGNEEKFGNLYVEYNVVLPDKVEGDLRRGEF